MWFDMDENGRLDSQGRYERKMVVSYDDNGNEVVEPGDRYIWQEGDLYSGIHNINTDAEAFNIDIDADGAMDFFIAQDLGEGVR